MQHSNWLDRHALRYVQPACCMYGMARRACGMHHTAWNIGPQFDELTLAPQSPPAAAARHIPSSAWATPGPAQRGRAAGQSRHVPPAPSTSPEHGAQPPSRAGRQRQQQPRAAPLVGAERCEIRHGMLDLQDCRWLAVPPAGWPSAQVRAGRRPASICVLPKASAGHKQSKAKLMQYRGLGSRSRRWSSGSRRATPVSRSAGRCSLSSTRSFAAIKSYLYLTASYWFAQAV